MVKGEFCGMWIISQFNNNNNNSIIIVIIIIGQKNDEEQDVYTYMDSEDLATRLFDGKGKLDTTMEKPAGHCLN